MSRGMFKLSLADLGRLGPGFHSDGANLYLSISRNRAGDDLNKQWIFRFKLPGQKERNMGLGAVERLGANASGLALARAMAQSARQLLAQGVDPIEQRKQARAEKAAETPVPTFETLAAEYLVAKDGTWTARVVAHWQMTFRDYCAPINRLPVNLINVDKVLACLRPIWSEKTATAERVRNRIERVLSFATVRKFRQGENPARWRDNLDHLLPAPNKISKTKNFAALDFRAMPAFMGELRARKPIAGTLALEFLVLCASRTDEVLKATWDEIDFDAKTWTISAQRMKMRKEHVVPLSARALDVLKAAREINPSGQFIFCGYDGSHLSSSSLRALLQRRMGRGDVTTHGMRAAFKTWAGESTNFPRDLVEMCLAHQIGNKSEASYRRGSMIEKRRRIMDAWARYCAQPMTEAKLLTFAKISL